MLQHTFSEVTIKCFFNLHIRWVSGVNPLNANSDRQQFSRNNIHALSRDKVMRINKMITIDKMLWSLIKFSQLIVWGDVWRSVWRICMWILGLKGLIWQKSPFVRKSIKICKSWIWIQGTGFLVLCQWNLDSGFQSLVGVRIRWAVFRIPKAKIPGCTSKISGSWIPNAKFPRLRDPKLPYKGRKESITWQMNR